MHARKTKRWGLLRNDIHSGRVLERLLSSRTRGSGAKKKPLHHAVFLGFRGGGGRAPMISPDILHDNCGKERCGPNTKIGRSDMRSKKRERFRIGLIIRKTQNSLPFQTRGKKLQEEGGCSFLFHWGERG